MELSAVNPELIHTHLLEPYLQGATLVEFAWTGKDHSIIPKQFFWEERAILWLKGMCLLIPVISNVIWIAWKTFGNPQFLADPYSPEITEIPPLPPPASQVQIPTREVQAPEPLQGQARPSQNCVYKEHLGLNLEGASYETSWTIQHFPDLVIANQTCTNPRFTASYIYKPDLSLKEFSIIRGARVFQTRIIEETSEVVINYQNVGVSYEKRLPLPEDVPIIQHPVVGLKNFVLSTNQETSFYGVVPTLPRWFPSTLLSFIVAEPPFLEKVEARKAGIENIPGYGPAIKIESWSSRGFPFNLWIVEAWFDPRTGSLVKYNNPFAKMSGIFARSGQLPE